MKRFLFLKVAGILIVVGGLLAAGLASYRHNSSKPGASLQTVPVRQGNIEVAISATGTVEPEEVVDVGAQVAGQITAFGRDKKGKQIDYGSVVQAGTVLARIDDSLYSADVAQNKAQLVQAQANEQRAEADLGQLKAKLDQAQRDWERAQKLGPSEALARSAYDGYKAAYETAKSNVEVGQATIAQNKGAVVQAEAALKRSQRNLGYCTIVSPVDGVIIDRRVNIGQTVVSSLNAPSLFLIAKDLTRMQVWVAVNEADIGKIRLGQPVTFTVDARPGEVFSGKVGKIRLNATMTQNVVTYTVEVITDNSSGKLLPYLTANIQFEVARRANVLMVPNAALRWTPKPQQIASGVATAGEPAAQPPAKVPNQGGTGTLWVSGDDGVRPIEVQTGISNGSMTEVQGDSEELQPGLEVVAGDQEQPDGHNTGATNPFAPRINRGRPESQSPRQQ